jgi:hypothetical protein
MACRMASTKGYVKFPIALNIVFLTLLPQVYVIYRADVDILDEKIQEYTFIILLLTIIILIWIIDVFLHMFIICKAPNKYVIQIINIPYR